MAEAQTAGLREQTRFDQADRIRRTLLRYMEENRIGVPTLQKLVATANNVGLDNIPLKTLQRFLGDTHRSNDIMVKFCHRFAADLPDDDPIAGLGEALIGFFGVTAHKSDWQPVPSGLNGSFTARAEPAVNRMGVSQDGTDHWLPFSTFTITNLPARPFALVQEIITNWARTKSLPEQTVRRVYEGVIFHPAGSIFVLMRNVLTGTPRLYWLVPSHPFPLTGHGHESVGSLDERPTIGPELFRADRVIFERAPGEQTP